MAAIQLGNFTGQPGGIFPMDTGTLDAMQNNLLALMTLGSIGGTNVIISGCEANSAGNSRDAGWLFLTTDSYPFGELIYFVGGSVSDGFYISEDTVQVAAEGVNYNAYKIRSAKPGDGTEHFEWEEIKSIKTNVQLEAMLTAAIDAAVPVGTIRMFAGPMDKVPEGWLACNGATYDAEDYPKLYAIIGTSYGNTPPSGKFNVPNLSGNFTRHAGGGKNIGDTGGNTYITLQADQLPQHEHQVDDYYFVESDGGGNAVTGIKQIGSNLKGSGDSDSDNSFGFFFRHNTEPEIFNMNGISVGLQQTVDVTPSYLCISYIIRAK